MDVHVTAQGVVLVIAIVALAAAITHVVLHVEGIARLQAVSTNPAI